MNAAIYLAIAAVAYLLGAIPFGLILVRVVRGEDVRLSGSGNIGATNVTRLGGAKLGIITLVLDAAKGYLAVRFAIFVSSSTPAVDVGLAAALAALCAILGHIFPLWLKFRGGKGVATAVGAFLGVKLTIFTLFTASIAGSLVGLSTVLTVWIKRTRRRIARNHESPREARRHAWESAAIALRRHQMPFGVFLGSMALVAFLFGDRFLHWYWGLL